MPEDQQNQGKLCKRSEDHLHDNHYLAGRALWGSEYCARHLQEQGDEAVLAWCEKVEGNKYSLAGANLFGAPLLGANLIEANLLNAKLERANLRGAWLAESWLENSWLEQANLHGAILNGADLQGANLSEADLQGASLNGAKLRGARLYGANLQGAHISSSDLSNAYMHEADLRNADLRKSRLEGADLRDINQTKSSRWPWEFQRIFIKCWLMYNQDGAWGVIKILCFSLIFLFLIIAPFLGLPDWIKNFNIVTLCIFVPWWPIIFPLVVLRIVGKRIEMIFVKAEATLGAIKENEENEIDEDEESSWARIEARMLAMVEGMVRPTIWCGASVEAAGIWDPVLLRYIKDQVWLEARIAESENGESSFDRAWMFLWGMTSKYGSSIGVWAFWSVLAALSFGAVYWVGGERLVSVDPGFESSRVMEMAKRATDLDAPKLREMEKLAGKTREPGIMTYLYFSIVTFTTLGFGDVTPKNWVGEVVVMSEVILGYLMLGGLISILATKLARRA